MIHKKCLLFKGSNADYVMLTTKGMNFEWINIGLYMDILLRTSSGLQKQLAYGCVLIL